MRVLDLGYGTGSSTIAWVKHGHQVVGVDWESKHNATITGDYFSTNIWKRILEHGPYNFVWASPDCRLHSLSGSLPWEYRNGILHPTTEEASLEQDNLFWLVRQIQSLKVPFVIENPVGMMSKQWFMKPLHKVKISLCQYGANVMKPTHLMGDIPAHFRPLFCGNGRSCHEAAPRSSKTGTQGLEDAETRAMMPYGLSMAIYQAFLTSNGQTYSRLSDFI